MAATGVASDRTWGWYGAAAVASAAFPAVFVHATFLANWYVDHPVAVPGDDSPGGGNTGAVIAVSLFAVGAIVCLLFPLLWAITALKRRRAAGGTGLALLATALQGAASLLVFPVAAALSYGWVDVMALVAADLLALGVALQPLWSRRAVTR
jgi:hypothetical protein